MSPYLSTRYTVRAFDSTPRRTVELEDDQPGCVRIEDEVHAAILVNIDEIPALILALREVMRENRRVKREMESEPADTAYELGAPATAR